MRRKDREISDMKEILKIVKKARILHMGLFGNEYPYVVPLHYGYEFIDNTLVFFVHGAKKGYKLDLIKDNPHICVELECDIELVSGENVPCKYGSTYASVIGRGIAEIVTDEQEKIKGLKLLMENQTGRMFDINDKMAASVEVIKLNVTDFTAKRRV